MLFRARTICTRRMSTNERHHQRTPLASHPHVDFLYFILFFFKASYRAAGPAHNGASCAGPGCASYAFRGCSLSVPPAVYILRHRVPHAPSLSMWGSLEIAGCRRRLLTFTYPQPPLETPVGVCVCVFWMCKACISLHMERKAVPHICWLC